MTSKIWLIGGTTESITIASAIASVNLPYIITVTTESARSLYSLPSEISIGCMNLTQMKNFCWQKNIKLIVDSSHPYAVEVSQNAIATAKEINIPYLRYERASIGSAVVTNSDSPIVTRLDSFAALLAGNYLENNRVLLTVGCKALPLFKSWHDRTTLFARILPKTESLKIALESGFTSDRLIAIRPPIKPQLEKALCQQWNIWLIVTKASGKAGGEDIKLQVATDLNIPLIIISRPKVFYPQQTSCINKVVAFCRQHLLNNQI